MRSYPVRCFPVIGVLAAFAILSAPATAAIATVSWAAGDSDDVTVLRVAFDGPAPVEHEVTADSAGVRVRLPATEAPDDLPSDVRATEDGDGTTLVLARPGSRLAAVRVRDGRLEVALRSAAARSTAGDYRLGPGDVVSVEVYEDKSLSGEYTVGQDGSVNLPLVGAVPAVGATETELAGRLRAALLDYVDARTLSVTILRFESQSVYVNVTGDAPRAAKVALRPGMRLADVLAEAGVALQPLQKVRLTRATAEGGRSSRTLTTAEIETASAPIPRDGDVLTVLEPEYVFVRGEVERAGRWIYRPGMTLQEVIALAGGLGEWANRKEVRILRRGEEGRAREIDVNLKKIEDGRQPDPELEPRDLILVRRRVL